MSVIKTRVCYPPVSVIWKSYNIQCSRHMWRNGSTVGDHSSQSSHTPRCKEPFTETISPYSCHKDSSMSASPCPQIPAIHRRLSRYDKVADDIFLIVLLLAGKTRRAGSPRPYQASVRTQCLSCHSMIPNHPSPTSKKLVGNHSLYASEWGVTLEKWFTHAVIEMALRVLWRQGYLLV